MEDAALVLGHAVQWGCWDVLNAAERVSGEGDCRRMCVWRVRWVWNGVRLGVLSIGWPCLLVVGGVGRVVFDVCAGS